MVADLVGNRVQGDQVGEVDAINDIPNAPPVSTISTADLPGGVPEYQMKNAKDHRLGHVKSLKKTMES